jgi:hypothetical protein
MMMFGLEAATIMISKQIFNGSLQRNHPERGHDLREAGTKFK